MPKEKKSVPHGSYGSRRSGRTRYQKMLEEAYGSEKDEYDEIMEDEEEEETDEVDDLLTESYMD